MKFRYTLKIVFLLLFGLNCYSSSVIAQTYQISLLTCDPGDELYNAFGHNGLRVLDLDTGNDLVFNWGTFDFGAPNFYGKFAMGRLDYFLSFSTYQRFIYNYQMEQRAVREQILNLSPEQTSKMLALLNENARPENIYYRYDFFYDNCATRIRDIVEATIGDQLVWQDPADLEEKTFRDLIDEFVYDMPWADLGIDLALGSVIDNPASERERQFLPNYMEAAFARAEIVGDGPARPLVTPSRIVLDYPPVVVEQSIFNPYVLFWVVAFAAIIITYVGFKRKKLFIGFDMVFFIILGLMGLVIFFLWFITEHNATLYNWNILWAFPVHLALAYGLALKTPTPWVRQYLLFALIMADIAVVFWILGWQSFHPSIVPLLLVIILRTNYLYYNLERIKFMKPSIKA